MCDSATNAMELTGRGDEHVVSVAVSHGGEVMLWKGLGLQKKVASASFSGCGVLMLESADCGVDPEV